QRRLLSSTAGPVARRARPGCADGQQRTSPRETRTRGSPGRLGWGMSVDLEQVRTLSLRENGLATVATTRADGTVHSSVVNAGVFADPVTGAPGVAYVAVGRAHKLALLRRAGHATVTFRRGWNWVSVTGATHLVGPDDPNPA